MDIYQLPGFTGACRDAVTAGYLLGNGYRLFLPQLMRFNAADTLSPFDAGGINPYSYCEGDPTNLTDPSGHAPFPASRALMKALYGLEGRVEHVAEEDVAIAAQQAERAGEVVHAAPGDTENVGVAARKSALKSGNVPRPRRNVRIAEKADFSVREFKKSVHDEEYYLEIIVDAPSPTTPEEAALISTENAIGDAEAQVGTVRNLMQTTAPPSLGMAFQVSDKKLERALTALEYSESLLSKSEDTALRDRTVDLRARYTRANELLPKREWRWLTLLRKRFA